MSTNTENTIRLPLPRGLKGDAAQAWNDLLGVLGDDATVALAPLMTLAAEWVGRSRRLERKLRGTSIDAPHYPRLVKLSAISASQATKMMREIRLTVMAKYPTPAHQAAP